MFFSKDDGYVLKQFDDNNLGKFFAFFWASQKLATGENY